MHIVGYGSEVDVPEMARWRTLRPDGHGRILGLYLYTWDYSLELLIWVT